MRTTSTCYEHGITDYVNELVGDKGHDPRCSSGQAERTGRDRADQPDYQGENERGLLLSPTPVQAFGILPQLQLVSSTAARRTRRCASAFVSQVDAYLKSKRQVHQERKQNHLCRTWQDCLVLVIVLSFSTQTSYENQTKKAITNKFVQEAMTEFLAHQLEVYFIGKPSWTRTRSPSRCWSTSGAGNTRKRRASTSEKDCSGNMDLTNRVSRSSWTAAPRTPSDRELYIVEGDSAMGACQAEPRRGVPGHHARSAAKF